MSNPHWTVMVAALSQNAPSWIGELLDSVGPNAASIEPIIDIIRTRINPAFDAPDDADFAHTMATAPITKIALRGFMVAEARRQMEILRSIPILHVNERALVDALDVAFQAVNRISDKFYNDVSSHYYERAEHIIVSAAHFVGAAAVGAGDGPRDKTDSYDHEYYMHRMASARIAARSLVIAFYPMLDRDVDLAICDWRRIVQYGDRPAVELVTEIANHVELAQKQRAAAQ